MEDRKDQDRGGIEIERDEYGRSDIQREQQADMNGGRQVGSSNGYGQDQNSENMQGQQGQASYGNSGQSRGERFDEQQGGGRGPDSIDQQQGDATEFGRDQMEHQDRGQSEIDEESDRT